MKVVFASHTNLGSDFKVGSYHYSSGLAELNDDVLHLSKPVTPLHFFSKEGNNFKRRLKIALMGEANKGKVKEIIPFFLLPQFRFLDFRLFYMLSPAYWFLRYRLSRCSFRAVDVVIIDEHSFYWLPKLIKAKKWVYRPTDMVTKSSSKKWSEIILKFADGLVCTSQPLLSYFQNFYKVTCPSVLIENGVDFKHFSIPVNLPEEYLGITDKIIVYVGALDYRFDFEAVDYIARNSVDISFILIGPKPDKIPDLPPNVIFLGARSYNFLPAYLQHADAGFLFMTKHPQNNGRSPMKLYEYQAAGLPVLCSVTDELKRRSSKGIYFYSDRNEMVNALESTVNSTVDVKSAAEQHSWSKKSHELYCFYQSLLA